MLRNRISVIILMMCLSLAGNFSMASAGEPQTVKPSFVDLVSATYLDTNNSGVGAGDQLVLTFDRAIVVKNVTASDFSLPVVGDSFGAGATFKAGSSNSQIIVTLGNGAKINTKETFNVAVLNAGSPSGIGISSANDASNHITDTFGNAAQSRYPIDIMAPGDPRLVKPSFIDLISATFTDFDNNGVGAGDQITLTFSQQINANNVFAADFSMPVVGDSLGLNPTFKKGASPAQLIITLGSVSKITVAGVFNQSSLAPGSPSGISVSPLNDKNNHITDLFGNAAQPSNGVDIAGTQTNGPKIKSVIYSDSDGGSGLSAGDKITLTFDRAVTLEKASICDFFLPVCGDTFGAGATVGQGAANDQIVITLGVSCQLTIAGYYTPFSANTTGSASGLGINFNYIRDVNGNMAQPFCLDIATKANEVMGPRILCASLNDVDCNGVGMGDQLTITFDKPILSKNVEPSDFSLPSGDNFGTGATCKQTVSNQIVITLGAGAKIAMYGNFDPASYNVGSGVFGGLGIKPGNIHITDVNGNAPFAGSSVGIVMQKPANLPSGGDAKLANLKYDALVAKGLVAQLKKDYDRVSWLNVFKKVRLYFSLKKAEEAYTKAEAAVQKYVESKPVSTNQSTAPTDGNAVNQDTQQVQITSNQGSANVDNGKLILLRGQIEAAYKEYVKAISSSSDTDADKDAIEKARDKYKSLVEQYNQAVAGSTNK